MYGKEYWDENYKGIEQFLHWPIHEEIADWIALYYDVIGKRCLDLGGGPGIHAKLLYEKYGADCINLDCSPYAVTFTDANIAIVLRDFEKFGIGEVGGQFDFIFSISVLEHCEEENINSIAKDIFMSLKKGGYCFISVGAEYMTGDKTHKTLKPLVWWYRQFLAVGFTHDNVRERIALRSNLPTRRLDWQCLFLKKS